MTWPTKDKMNIKTINSILKSSLQEDFEENKLRIK